MKYIVQIFSVILFVSSSFMNAQHFSEKERLQGYAFNHDTTWFIFDETLYKTQPTRVQVTGTFCNWNQDMSNSKWSLQKTNKDLWILSVQNPGYSTIPPSSEYKFRINEGVWLNPPQNSTNINSGNLVFLMGVTPPTLKAEIKKQNIIWADIKGIKRPLNRDAYQLTDSHGTIIEIASVLPNTSTETYIMPKRDLDIRKVYFLGIPSHALKTFCSFDGWFRELYSDKELGANISEDGKSTAFRIFSPRADMVKLYLYKSSDDKSAYKQVEMNRDNNGVWEMIFEENMHGMYYDYTVHGPDEPGNHFYETDPVHISDPYARVSIDTWGKCRVWEKTTPSSPLKNGIPAMEDIIAYEVHIQDFTDLLPVDKSLKGTIPAMIKSGLRNSHGEKIGFDYLLDLGINVVHLMPIQEYLHYEDEDWKNSFENDPYMIEQGISEENYQWGYRTSHAFAVESRYRLKGTEPGAQREQFRDLVQAFHDHDIAVIIDIVPNHTAENMDGNHWNFHFNVLDKLYYYRTKNFEHLGAYGNEVKTENRPMVQKWLIEQCTHYINEFGIDGFRIDLAGQIDEQTLYALKEQIGHDKIVYGEAWIGSNDPEYENNPDWDWYKEDSPITFFQDDTRNAFKGPVFVLKSKETDRGYAGGNESERENVKKGLSSNFPDDKTPLSGINYLDIHDNYALADRFAVKNWDGRFGVEEDRYKIAAVLLYTSLGPIVTHGGTEIMRSKGLAPLKEVVKQTKDGIDVFLHGKRDTYNMRNANHFIWENVGKTKENEGSYCDYKGMYEFWKGLNHFRLSEYGKVFRVNQAVDHNYYQWIEPENLHLLGYIINNKVFVLLNTDDATHLFNQVYLPPGKWKLIANNDRVDHINGVSDPDSWMEFIEGGHKYTFNFPARNLKIWIKY